MWKMDAKVQAENNKKAKAVERAQKKLQKMLRKRRKLKPKKTKNQGSNHRWKGS